MIDRRNFLINPEKRYQNIQKHNFVKNKPQFAENLHAMTLVVNFKRS